MTFEEFAATRMPGVLRFAAVLAGDRATAEDLAQEVLIRAYARWDTDRLSGPAGTLRPQDDAQRVPQLAPPVLAPDTGRRYGQRGRQHRT